MGDQSSVKSSPTAWLMLGLLTIFAGLVGPHIVAGPDARWLPAAGFLGTLFGILFLFFAFGLAITNSAFGILRSGNNTYSLARLQMAAWTWLILSALIAVAVARLWHQYELEAISSLVDAAGGEAAQGAQVATALNIYIPDNLFLVMGISFFTGAAAPALLSLKATTQPTAGQIATARSRMSEDNIVTNGQLIVRKLDQQPHLGDLVEGDDLATAGTVDISKVQQLLITALLIGVYFAMLWNLFVTFDHLWGIPQDLRTQLINQNNLLCGLATQAAANAANCGADWAALPDFPASLVTLLAVSHGGYLAYKAVPRSAPDNSGAATNTGGGDTSKAVG